MPKVDGLDIILHLRSHARPVKVLAISGSLVPGFNAYQAAKAFGASEVLSNPFSQEQFLGRVDTLLAQPSL